MVDYIICDYNMDNGNGLQLLQTVRTGTVSPVRLDPLLYPFNSVSYHDTVGNAARLDVSGDLVKPATKEKISEATVKAHSRLIKIDIPRYQQAVLP